MVPNRRTQLDQSIQVTRMRATAWWRIQSWGLRRPSGKPHSITKASKQRRDGHDGDIWQPARVGQPNGHLPIACEMKKREPKRNLQPQRYCSEGHRIAESHQHAMAIEFACNGRAPTRKSDS